MKTAAGAATTSKQIFRTSSCKSVPDDRFAIVDVYRNRDSGTSSPQPPNVPCLSTQCSADSNASSNGLPITPSSSSMIQHQHCSEKKSKRSLLHVKPHQHQPQIQLANDDVVDIDSDDSNDSVFSSGSSSIDLASDHDHRQQHVSGIEIRDLYLGGSCMLRTNWRQDIAIPMLKQRGVSYHLPTLHESITVVPIVPTSMNQQSNDRDGVTTGSTQIPMKRKKSRREHETILAVTEATGGDIAGARVDAIGDLTTALNVVRKPMFNPALLESCRVLLFVITNETRSLAPMTLAAHYIGLGYNIVLCVEMLPEFCVIGNDRVS